MRAEHGKRRALRGALLPLLAICLPALCLLSCGRAEPVIIWTDRAEIVSYVEFFNVAQNKAKAVVVYKDKVALSLPPAKDEKSPDIVIGSLLRNSNVKKRFTSLDRVFSRSQINPASIYAPLLDYGKVNGRQYLIPVSFNLPTVIFSARNAGIVPEGVMIDADTIRDTAASFNLSGANGIMVRMGYAPSWDTDFLYQAAKLGGAEFGEKGTAFSWNAASLGATVGYLREWSAAKNGGTDAEQDFSFKYLYAPAHKLVNSDRCLFAYTTSDVFFDISTEQTEDIDFKWLSGGRKIFVSDSLTSLGVYRRTKNAGAAYEFVNWFFSETTQRNLLDRAMRMRLDTQTFGICNGFSSIKSVNERVFPAYYKNLLGKLPAEESLVAPLPLPSRWESLKERVIIPYLYDSVNTSAAQVRSIEERVAAWRNQFN